MGFSCVSDALNLVCGIKLVLNTIQTPWLVSYIANMIFIIHVSHFMGLRDNSAVAGLRAGLFVL